MFLKIYPECDDFPRVITIDLFFLLYSFSKLNVFTFFNKSFIHIYGINETNQRPNCLFKKKPIRLFFDPKEMTQLYGHDRRFHIKLHGRHKTCSTFVELLSAFFSKEMSILASKLGQIGPKRDTSVSF